MQSKKSMIYLLAVTFLVAGLLQGCSSKETANDNEEKRLSYWMTLPSQLTSHYNSMSEVTMYKELEKKTGVKIDFIHPPSGQESEKFSLMIAGGNMTDLVETNWKRYYQGGPSKALSDGIIYQLDEYLEEYAPNFTKFLSENDDTRRAAMTTDGHYCVFPNLKRSNKLESKNLNTNFGGMMLRKDWLDKLNLDVPETIDEWDAVLHAFKNKLGVNYPLQLESGWFKIEGHGNNFNNAFGVDLGWYVDNGKVKFGPAEPGYKKYIALMHRWYKEGILDNEFDTISKDSVRSRILEGKTGAFYGFIGSDMGPLLNAELPNKESTFDLIGAPYPVMNKGDEPYFMNWVTLVSAPYTAVTKKCKNPELAVAWMDNFYSEEGAILASYGIEGLTYTKQNEGVVAYTDEILNNPKGLTPTEALALHVRRITPAPGIAPLTEVSTSKYDHPSMQDAFETFNVYVANRLEVQMPELEYPVELTTEVSSIELDINTYVWETILRFIKGTEPMEKYDDFIIKLKTDLKLDRLIEIKQETYNSYMSKGK